MSYARRVAGKIRRELLGILSPPGAIPPHIDPNDPAAQAQHLLAQADSLAAQANHLAVQAKDLTSEAKVLATKSNPGSFGEPDGRQVRLNFSEDTNGSRATDLDALLTAIRARKINIFTGGEKGEFQHRLNIQEHDLKAVFDVAVELFGTDRVLIRFQNNWQRIIPGGQLEAALRTSVNVDAFILDEPLPEPGEVATTELSGSGLALEVITWAEHTGAYGKSYFETHRTNTVSKRLRPESFRKFAKIQHHMGEDLPSADVPTFDVDIVYTWVDGEDPEWLKRKMETQASLGLVSGESPVVRDERFRNRDELKYSLRSVEQFAPWVRTIHIVTAGQAPEWLNVDHPKIRLVDHADIYKDSAWLPTFNSSGIETQLHHVPDLADKFLYFNDDFFLGQDVSKADFFFGNGVIKYFPSTQKAYEHDIDETSEEYIQADKNALELFAKEYPAVNRHIMQHIPYPSDRLLLQELEDKYTEEFAACASEPFRSSHDLRPIAFMQYQYGFNEAKAMPGSLSHRYLALWKTAIFEQLQIVELERNKKTFCINDVGLQPERTPEVNNAVIDFLDAYFPEPSAFEM